MIPMSQSDNMQGVVEVSSIAELRETDQRPEGVRGARIGRTLLLPRLL